MHRRNEAGCLYKEWNTLMELELDRTQMNGYDALLDTTLLREETLEMIVPDACPDILRVVETDGKVLLRSKEAMEGRVEISGTFKACVLYLPDGESGLRHLEVSIPFTCSAEGREIGPSCNVVASLRLHHADTRAVNPRKVLVRAEAAVDVAVYAPMTESVCGQVLDAAEQSVEQLTETREVYVTACVQEKPFSLSDEVALSASKPAAAELLKSRVELCRGESKIIGNKLIFKGSANVSLFYRGEDDGVYSSSAELPFSQIMEVSGVGESAECDLSFTLTGASCSLDPGGDGRTVSVSLEALSQSVVRESRMLEVLSDAYSTSQPMAADWENYPMSERVDRGVRSQSVREVWETGGPIRDVLDCRLAVGQIVKSREGERMVLTAQVEVTALYIGEDGGLYSAQRQMSVPCALDLPEESQCFCQCEGVGDVYATPAAGGIEARFTLDFRYCATARRQITALSALRPAEAVEVEGLQPSLVLRMLEGGERLWDVAKAYSTTIADIMSANELADEAAAMGRLLLIPRKR